MDDRAEADQVLALADVVDDGGAAQALFELRDLAFQLGLLVLGVVVLGVFGDVTEIAGLADSFGYFTAPDGREVLDFLFELLQTIGGNFRLATHVYLPLLTSAARRGRAAVR